MLFTSPQFLFVFLPLTIGMFYLLSRTRSSSLSIYWLILASLFFYGWWNPRYLLLIGASIVFNYGISLLITRSRKSHRKMLLILGIVANLCCLAYFKYAMFLTDNINSLFSANLSVGKIILPLAISFFTFQQITFLVDTYKSKIHDFQFSHYCLFVLFFPQLIAGPIVHHKEMMPQFTKIAQLREVANNFNRGLTVFTLGLFKKMVLADSLARIADPAFSMAEQGRELSLLDAWSGALAYTFQLYFDFSGYSDMAVGLAILFGISLPLNFYSPYKATSIIEFWRRWHMTLSRFLKDYVYIPLGGNRCGRSRKHVNLMLTMLIGGIWHGAGWSFAIWGVLHGLYLVINHFWRAILARMENPSLQRVNSFLAPVLTFLCVVVAWVYFRAPTLEGAHFMLLSMIDCSQLQGASFALTGTFMAAVTELPLQDLLVGIIENPKAITILVVLLSAATIAFLLPNSVDLMQEHHPALAHSVPAEVLQKAPGLRWHPNLRWAAILACLLLLALSSASSLSPFLYFQF